MKSSQQSFTVDFVARTSSEQWLLVLVEQGPWEGAFDDELYRTQNRLYETLDAALDGQVAEQFPESKGKAIKIRLDCYDLPEECVSPFFVRFAKGVLETPDYKSSLSDNEYVSGISFEIGFE